MAKITIVRGSPPEYEELIIYVYLDEVSICIVQMEEGAEKLIVEFYDNPTMTKVYYKDLIEALELAKFHLLDGYKPPEADK